MPAAAYAVSICTRRRSTICAQRRAESIFCTSGGVTAALSGGIAALALVRCRHDRVGDLELHLAHASDDKSDPDFVFAFGERTAAHAEGYDAIHAERHRTFAGYVRKRSRSAVHVELRVLDRHRLAVDGEGQHLLRVTRTERVLQVELEAPVCVAQAALYVQPA